MTETTRPAATAPSGISPANAPRFISNTTMSELLGEGLATVLSNRERYRMFMRYNDSWWVGDRDGFTEITSPTQNQKLDTWHRRLNEGALWA